MEPSPILAVLLATALVAPPATPASHVLVSAPPTAVSVLPEAVLAPPEAVPGPGGPQGGLDPVPTFRWPLPGTPSIARRFDPPPQPWLSGHRGVDLAAAPGVPVSAAGAGVVTFAGTVAGRPVVTVGHADGLRTTYEPVLSGAEVGSPVSAGALIGYLLGGHRGCAAPACLHWGLRRGDTYLDPLALLGRGPVRLLPLDGGLR